MSREEAFDRIAYFLERVIPVAEANRVQMACHPNDPPAPILRGVERWNYPVFDGLKRFSEIVDSPYHGFNFCCGTVSEGLDDPATEFYEILRSSVSGKNFLTSTSATSAADYTASKRFGPTRDTWDMHKVAQTLRDVAYPYMLMLTTPQGTQMIHRPRVFLDGSDKRGHSNSDTSSP